jgi:LPS-assembly protein
MIKAHKLPLALCCLTLPLSGYSQSQEQTEPSEQAITSGFDFQPLSWYPLELLSAQEKAALPSFCAGKYRIPDIEPRSDDSILIEADSSVVDRDGNANLQGDVEFRQQDKMIRGDRAIWSQNSRNAEFNGNVTLVSPELIMSGDKAVLTETSNGQDGKPRNDALVENAEYSVPAMHARGTAGQIQIHSDQQIELFDATYTFCEPGRNDWDIAAAEIYLDQESGIGSTWHTFLRIKEFPVMYLPYYRFPIDDRRMTGFLDPYFAINGEVQASEISTPFYWNIHPQADATITPRQLLNRGLLWETQFRHLTDTFGYGELNYGRLNWDETDEDERWLINYQQNGDITQHWKHRWVYNHISDPDYLRDMSPNLSIDRSTHTPTRGEIYFNKSAWHFDLTAERFQTLDETIALASRPYRREPQLNLSFAPDNLIGFDSRFKAQATDFSRDSQDLTGISAIEGQRFIFDSAISYSFEWPFAFIKPKAEYKFRQYQLENVDQSLLDADYNESPYFGIPKYSLDAGLFFERELNFSGSDYIQTLEPRLLHLQVPYYDQSEVPNFDTSALTFNYNQLFRDYRFNGGDRVGDANQTTLGLTTRFLRDDGVEQFNASIGQIFYHDDRRVQLSGTALSDADTRKSSSTVVESNWSPFDHWRVYGMLEWGKNSAQDSDYQALQEQFTIEYNDDMNHMANIGLRSNEASQVRQLDIGVFWALNDSWALIGSRKKDLWNYKDGEIEPVDPVIEALAGFEYQSCCWRAQFLYQEQTKRDTLEVNADGSQTDTDKSYGFLIRLELKGLGNFGSNPDTIMNQSIRGYSRRHYYDFEQ